MNMANFTLSNVHLVKENRRDKNLVQKDIVLNTLFGGGSIESLAHLKPRSEIIILNTYYSTYSSINSNNKVINFDL